MKKQPHRNQGILGFTLTELLAAVAIIAIIVALLFPGARRLIGNANQARCQGNLRNLGAAIFSYAADHSGGFPPAAQTYDGYWYDLLVPYVDDDHNAKLPSQRPTVPKWLVCPDKPGLLGYGWNQTYFGNHVYLPTSTQAPDETAFAKLSQVSHPARTIIIGDSKDATVQPANDYQNRYVYTRLDQGLWATRHSGGGFYFFCDGHIERLTPVDLDKQQPYLFQKVKEE